MRRLSNLRPCFNATGVGPMPIFLLAKISLVTVGIKKHGPMPHVNPLFELEGLKNALVTASPKPFFHLANTGDITLRFLTKQVASFDLQPEFRKVKPALS